MSPMLAFVGISVLGTWGLASIGLIVAGIIMLATPGGAQTSSDATLGGIVLLVAGLISAGTMQVVIAPLLGLDPPFPLSAKKIIPASKLTRWAKAGLLRDFPDATPKEVRIFTKRVLIVRMGDTAYALNALCSHARLPIGGFPGTPLKAYPVRDNCVMCPFHGARFDIETGKVARQPFDSAFNNQHPFAGRLQSKVFSALSKIPAPPGLGLSMKAEDSQTYPVKIENGEVMVALPKK